MVGFHRFLWESRKAGDQFNLFRDQIAQWAASLQLSSGIPATLQGYCGRVCIQYQYITVQFSLRYINTRTRNTSQIPEYPPAGTYDGVFVFGEGKRNGEVTYSTCCCDDTLGFLPGIPHRTSISLTQSWNIRAPSSRYNVRLWRTGTQCTKFCHWTYFWLS